MNNTRPRIGVNAHSPVFVYLVDQDGKSMNIVLAQLPLRGSNGHQCTKPVLLHRFQVPYTQFFQGSPLLTRELMGLTMATERASSVLQLLDCKRPNNGFTDVIVWTPSGNLTRINFSSKSLPLILSEETADQSYARLEAEWADDLRKRAADLLGSASLDSAMGS